MTQFSVGDEVTWLERPNGRYAIEAVVVAVKTKKVRIQIARPSATIPQFKLVDVESLRPGKPEREIRWDEWNGLCRAGKHGLDYREQQCDLCPAIEDK